MLIVARGSRSGGSFTGRGEGKERGSGHNLRERSCLLRCSLLLKALLQNWHLYLRSGASEALREAGVDEADVGRTATLAPGILTARGRCREFFFFGCGWWVIPVAGKATATAGNGDDDGDDKGEWLDQDNGSR